MLDGALCPLSNCSQHKRIVDRAPSRLFRNSKIVPKLLLIAAVLSGIVLGQNLINEDAGRCRECAGLRPHRAILSVILDRRPDGARASAFWTHPKHRVNVSKIIAGHCGSSTASLWKFVKYKMPNE